MLQLSRIHIFAIQKYVVVKNRKGINTIYDDAQNTDPEHINVGKQPWIL